MPRRLSRRDFILTSTGAALAATSNVAGSTGASGSAFRGKLCLFSKPFPEMNWAELARAAKQIGFDGVDLTVRPQGHVLPERAADDLPRAVETIRGAGLEVPMITTALTSAEDPTARPILSTAAELDIPYFKPGYYYYKLVDVRAELEKAGKDFRGLVELAQSYRIQAGFHNHEEYVGAPVWDIARVMDTLDPKWAGFYFDPRHAVAEGGVGAWKIATNLVTPRLKMVAIKDFYWEKTARGWRAMNCPVGQGMVDWRYFFRALARARFDGPISLHMEYEVPGTTRQERETAVMKALEHDLAFLKTGLAEAYGQA